MQSVEVWTRSETSESLASMRGISTFDTPQRFYLYTNKSSTSSYLRKPRRSSQLHRIYKRSRTLSTFEPITMPALNPRGGHLGLILPLCTSSATVGMSLLQYPLFYAFLRPQASSIAKRDESEASEKISGLALSRFWTAFLAPAGSLIAGVALASTVSGLVASRWLRSHTTLETTAVSKWYTYGAVLAFGHLAFVPMVAGPILNITEARNSSNATATTIEERNEGAMKTWLWWHTVRTLLLDIPALWCFAEGAALSFWVI